MEQDMKSTAAAVPYDYRQYDQIWQRVSPSLNPYPGMEAPAEGTGSAAPSVSRTAPSVPQPPAAVRAEENLPGAAANPCCMGSAAMDDLAVVEGFIEGELADQRYYLAFSRQAPVSARQLLRSIAQDEGGHARRLMAVYYLITGRCYRPSVSCDRVYIGAWCPALRERYHEEACGWMNYIRAAEGTTDPCLQKTFTELAADELRHADAMRELLERSIAGTCGSR